MTILTMTTREWRLRRLIREYRESRGLLQAEVAAMIGVSRLTYHRVETGAGRISRFAEICQALEVDPEALMREAGYTAHTRGKL